MPVRRGSWGLLAVLGVAAAVRVWAFHEARVAPFWGVPQVDERAYIDLARELLAGRAPAYGAYYFAPGYTYFLALVFALGGGITSAKILNLLAGLAGAGCVWLLTRRFFGRGAATAAGIAAALLPTALLQELLVQKSALATLALLAGLLLLCGRSTVPPGTGRTTPARRPDGNGTRRWAAAGALFGAAGLLRAEMFAVAAALAIAGSWAHRRQWPGAVRPRAVLGFAVAAGVAVAVPTLQNARWSGDFVPVAFGGGTNFYIGNHAQADGSYVPLRPDRSDPPLEVADAVAMAQSDSGRELSPAAVSRYWLRRGLAWWGEAPLAAVRLTAKKALLVWAPHEIADVVSTPLAGRFVHALRLPLGAWLVVPLALVGVFCSRRRRELWPLHVVLLAGWLALVPFFLFERFRLHLVAASPPFAAHACVLGWEAFRRRRFHRLALGIAAAAAAGAGLAPVRVPRDEVVLRVNLGDMLFQAGRFGEALVEFEAVRRASPDAWRVDLNIANALVAQDRFGEAVPVLDRLLARLHAEGERTGQPSAEELVYAHELLGDLLFDLGRPADAARHYAAAIPFAPVADRPLLERKRAEAAARGG